MKSNKGLSQYRGPLYAREIAAGMNHALSNAKRLLSDAELLLANKRYPSALGITL
jgi:hypothetical protein